MKYKYIFHAEGIADENAVIRQMEQLGLSEIFVEKHLDIDSVVRDQNFSRDENYASKWEALCRTELLTEEMQNQISERMANKEKSMGSLAEVIQEVGIEMDMTNYAIGKILCDVLDFMNQQ